MKQRKLDVVSTTFEPAVRLTHYSPVLLVNSMLLENRKPMFSGV